MGINHHIISNWLSYGIGLSRMVVHHVEWARVSFSDSMREIAAVIHSLLLFGVNYGSVAIRCDLGRTSIDDTLVVIPGHARVRGVPDLSSCILLLWGHTGSVFDQGRCTASARLWSDALTDVFVSIADFV